MNAFGYTDDQVVFCLKTFFQRSKERFLVKIRLRQINQHRVVLLEFAGKYGCCGQPAGMAAHDLNDGNRFCIINRSVQSDFTDGSSHIFCGTAESRCVVGEYQVVVDRFRNTHDTYINVVGSSIAGKLADRIHRIVSSYIKKVTDVHLFKFLKQQRIDRII